MPTPLRCVGIAQLFLVKRMNYGQARLTAWMGVAVVSAFLVGRFRAVGVAVSIILGAVLIIWIHHVYPAPPGVWDEDGEEVQSNAFILLTIWCVSIFGLAELRSFFRHRTRTDENA